jgi:hypothetical protein
LPNQNPFRPDALPAGENLGGDLRNAARPNSQVRITRAVANRAALEREVPMYAKGNSHFDEVQGSASRRHPPPLIDEFAAEFAVSLHGFPADETAAKLSALVRHRNDLSPEVRQLLIKALQVIAARATGFADQLTENFDQWPYFA